MKIETTPLENQQVQVDVELESEVLQGYMRRAARKIAQDTRIPGFRPGKAPFDVVRRLYGDEAIQKEAVELMIDDVYPQMLTEANLEPSGPGTLKEISSFDPPKFSFIVPLAPEVTLGDYAAIRKEYAPAPVTDEEVEKVLSGLRNDMATAEPAGDRPAQEGDLVYVNLSGVLTQPAEGESETIIDERPAQFLIGDQDNDSWPYPGFSKELIGLSEGDVKDIEFTYPEDTPFTRLAGKAARFTVKVDSIKVMKYPEMDDEFAKSVGDFENFQALRDTVRTSLEARQTSEYDEQYVDELIDEIIAQSTIEYPPHMLEEEQEHILKHLQEDLAERKLDLDTYLKVRQLDRAAFIEQEVIPSAKKRLSRSLILEKIAQAENIQLDKSELSEAVNQRLGELSQSIAQDKKYRSKAAQADLVNALAFDTANRLFNERLMDRLKRIASGQAEAEEAAAAEVEAKAAELAPGTEGGETPEAGTTEA